ncbi:hypothetical protein PN462_09180 [Spirulina sp. CS-785/01]|uniref:hypothetical protein n=1 Tax=Spirulina sp. CS-785/01 TaxID=3021716 RepID=UPI00232CB940|nr:hypothetical protein [Spirulina sp. CS-785/01]MDB9313269.1 hypothetical protein [Spirulina sp. CS-785/01]
MTLTDDFAPMEEEQEEQSPYPAAFGITFTPVIVGAILGLAGLGGAIAIFITLIQPALQDLNELKTNIDNKDQEKQQLQQAQQRIASLRSELQTAQQQRQEVLTLFSGEQSLNTLLVNLNQQIQQGGQLLNYNPPQGQPQTITDGSFGPQVNNLLKRQTLSLEIEAPFEATLNILRDLERLQTLIVIKNLDTQVSNPESRVINSQGQIVTQGQPVLTSTFDLEILLPVSQEELAEQQAAQQPEGEEGQEGQQN